MASYKFIAKRAGVSGSTGGIPDKHLPTSTGGTLNVDQGIGSQHRYTTSKGKPALGSLSNQVARVSATVPANGQSRNSTVLVKSGSLQRSGGGSGGTVSGKKGSVPNATTYNAFKAANLRVSANGRTPSPPKINEAPTIASTKNKNLTMASVGRRRQSK